MWDLHNTEGIPMKRALHAVLSTVVMATMLLAALLPAGAAVAQQPPDQPRRGQSADALARRADKTGPVPLVVEIDRTRNGNAVAAEARRHQGTKTVAFDHLPYVNVTGRAETIRALARNPHVVGIWESVDEAPLLDASLPVINADDVQNLGWTGAGQTVVILDTGIDADHPFFADNNGGNTGTSRIISQACYSNAQNDNQVSLCPNGGPTDTGANSADVDGLAACVAAVNNCDHGTHVAGIAAGDGAGLTDPNAQAAGVAPDANIVAIQVFRRINDADTCGTATAPCLLTSTQDQVAALNRVAALATANPGWNITSVNMSLGGGNNTAACDGDPRKTAVDNLLAQRIITVVASGNNGFMNAVGAPACISTVVSVGATTNADGVTRNRGTLLDLFAPGDSINAPIVDDTYGVMGGTSMAAPHVAGAFAVLAEAYPTRNVAQLFGDMTSTGVPITYPIDNATPPATTTTPRLNLLAALQAPNAPPALTADQSTVTVNEGTIATNTGTVTDPEGDPITAVSASVGAVVDNGDGTWSWRWQTSDGPADTRTVTITATDDKGEAGSATFALVVDNVAPTVTIDPGQVTVIAEGDTVTVTAEFTDPGSLDTHTATIDWGVPVRQDGVEVSRPSVEVLDAGGPGVPRRGRVTGTYRYGDNDGGSGFMISVTVTDKDGGAGSDSVSLTVDNVNPTAGIDLGNTVLLNGVPTLVAKAGENVDLEAGATDPGSDDLNLVWDFGDGTVASALSLVNAPAADPLPSPTVQPRDETLAVTHAFVDACLYEAAFSATDDDGGSAAQTVDVIITGTADLARSAGYWSAEYRQLRRSDFAPETLECYLAIVRHASAVFDEAAALTTFTDAANVLRTNGQSSATALLDMQLLAAWLNFANGAYDLDEVVDTTGDRIADTGFLTFLVHAETRRLDPNTTRNELLSIKNALERLNNP